MKKNKPTTEVVPAEANKGLQPVADTISMMSPKVLEAQIALETEKRKLITKFISDHLKPGVDYGKIHINKNCRFAYEPHKCEDPSHFSKNALFKPGGEKFCSLFKMRAEFVKDIDTWEMLGSQAGTVCYLCKLYTAADVLVGEGRGVASVNEKKNPTHPNTTVKIAEKRAKIDAVLATGALSDFFTQDEDIIAGRPEEVSDLPEIAPGSPLNAPRTSAKPQSSIIHPKPAQKPQVSDEAKFGHLKKWLNLDQLDTETLAKEIKVLTQLEFKKENLSEIVSRLEVIYRERKNAKPMTPEEKAEEDYKKM
jgi:hypothetical protein